MRAEGDAEVWVRTFGGHAFRSRLTAAPGKLIERFGVLRFVMTLQADKSALSMHHVGWRLGPIPMPRFLRPKGIATERAIDGRFHFDVPIALPFVGQLVHYRGWLEPRGLGRNR